MLSYIDGNKRLLPIFGRRIENARSGLVSIYEQSCSGSQWRSFPSHGSEHFLQNWNVNHIPFVNWSRANISWGKSRISGFVTRKYLTTQISCNSRPEECTTLYRALELAKQAYLRLMQGIDVLLCYIYRFDLVCGVLWEDYIVHIKKNVLQRLLQWRHFLSAQPNTNPNKFETV